MQLIEFANFKDNIISKQSNYARDIYQLEKITGDWPDDEILINLCDKYNFGGDVSLGDKFRIVNVYTD